MLINENLQWNKFQEQVKKGFEPPKFVSSGLYDKDKYISQACLKMPCKSIINTEEVPGEYIKPALDFGK